MRFSRSTAAAVCLCAAFCADLKAQSTDDRASYRISMNQDAFFGFYPTIYGAFKMNDRFDWTVYGIFWTTPSFGTGGGGGLWTEFGTGVNIKTLDGKLTFTPQLGFLNGRLLSNGSFPMAMEGIVPNITANVNTSKVESEFYMGLYTSLRKGQSAGPSGALVRVGQQNNFVHWWLNGGAKLTRAFSAGLHYEALESNPSGTPNLPMSGVYKWFGPYVQMSLSSKFAVRFTAGADVMDRPANNGTNSFYKMTATYSFP